MFNAVVLADVDLPYWTSKVKHMAFTAIFSNICTAHAQKRLFMNFWYDTTDLATDERYNDGNSAGHMWNDKGCTQTQGNVVVE